MKEIQACHIVIGILCARCEHSHPKWGSPAEWWMVSTPFSACPCCCATARSACVGAPCRCKCFGAPSGLRVPASTNTRRALKLCCCVMHLQGLKNNKKVIVLDLKDESSDSKKNNTQIKEIMKTLQLMPFSSDPLLVKGLTAGVIKEIKAAMARAPHAAVQSGGSQFWQDLFVRVGVDEGVAQTYSRNFEAADIDATQLQDLDKDDLLVRPCHVQTLFASCGALFAPRHPVCRTRAPLPP